MLALDKYYKRTLKKTSSVQRNTGKDNKKKKPKYLHSVYTLKYLSERQAPSEEQDSLHLLLCARVLWILQMQKHRESLKLIDNVNYLRYYGYS